MFLDVQNVLTSLVSDLEMVVFTGCRKYSHRQLPTNMAYLRHDWLADQPRTAALLWLVIQVVPQSFTLWLKIDILVCHFVHHIRWKLSVFTAFHPYGIGQYSVQYPEKYL